MDRSRVFGSCLSNWLRIGASVAVLSVATLVSTPASAQNLPSQPGQPTTLKPPSPGKEDTSRPLVMTIIAGLVIAVTVVGANMIPAKRGHQD